MAALLKDLYNETYISILTETIQKKHPSFNSKTFKEDIFSPEWETKELKERMRHIATTLHKTLNLNYVDAIEILQLVFSQMNHSYALENMIFQDFVEVYGLEELELSLSALEHFTIGSSSEFAIRQFLIKYENETLKKMKIWAKSGNEHIRRLASEGSRPRLPWAVSLPRFKQNPESILEILEILKDDTSPYVRKSVANSLNDISKDNPEIFKELLKSWLGGSKECDAMIKHGARTLLKQSDREVLELFGFTKPNHITLENFSYSKKVLMPNELEFSFRLTSPKELGVLRVEYAIEFLRKSGVHNKKVFHLAQIDSTLKEKSFKKSYSFKPITTRVYYKGLQRLSLMINGVVFKEAEFTLL